MSLHRTEQVMDALLESLRADYIAVSRVWRDLDAQQFELQTGARTMVILRQGDQEIIRDYGNSIVDTVLEVDALCISSGDPQGEAGTSASTNLNALAAAVVKTVLEGPTSGAHADDPKHGLAWIIDIEEQATRELDTDETQFPWAAFAVEFAVRYRRSRTDPTTGPAG